MVKWDSRLEYLSPNTEYIEHADGQCGKQDDDEQDVGQSRRGEGEEVCREGTGKDEHQAHQCGVVVWQEDEQDGAGHGHDGKETVEQSDANLVFITMCPEVGCAYGKDDYGEEEKGCLSGRDVGKVQWSAEGGRQALDVVGPEGEVAFEDEPWQHEPVWC